MLAARLESVLCADDDPDINEVIHAALTLIAGLDVRIARSGPELIALALERAPDLVLIDVMMPGLDGPSTLKQMRSDPLLAHIPVIFLTAKVLSSDIEHIVPLGALGLIAKPFDPLKLGEQISALWEADRGAPAPGAPRSAPPKTAQVNSQVDELAGRFLRRAAADLLRLRRMIGRVGHGDAAALREVEHITHKIHGSGAMLGFHAVSAAAEVIESSASGTLAKLGAHGTIDQAALVRQLSGGVEGLAKAVEQSSMARGSVVSVAPAASAATAASARGISIKKMLP